MHRIHKMQVSTQHMVGKDTTAELQLSTPTDLKACNYNGSLNTTPVQKEPLITSLQLLYSGSEKSVGWRQLRHL